MLAKTEKKKVPILMYHSISEYATAKYRPFAVSPSLFAKHMAYLHLHAYTPITVTQLVHAVTQREAALPERPIVLTLDDGFADFFTEPFLYFSSTALVRRFTLPADLSAARVAGCSAKGRLHARCLPGIS